MDAWGRFGLGTVLRWPLLTPQSPAIVAGLQPNETVRIVEQDDLAAMSDYLDKEIETAWQRKAAFESRAFPLVTMNVGLLTIYLTLMKVLDLKIVTSGFWPTICAVGVVVAAAVSILCAAFIAMPANYPGYTPVGFLKLYREVLNNKQASHPQRVVEAKIKTYDIICAVNQKRAKMVFTSFISMSVLACLLIISAIVAL
ncbi:hypothetical protein ACQP0C_31395 [Nocardia sp. CA-129566]|uniref:hypothetical protein n=1 Tax=Nocardia sp. CA-129566 TaxID=3239976 RepID=UPI003D997CBA